MAEQYITVLAPDGTSLQFPVGTSEAEMRDAVEAHLSQKPAPAPKAAPAPAPKAPAPTADLTPAPAAQSAEERPGEVSPSGGQVPTQFEDVAVEGRPLQWRDVPGQAIQNIPESFGNLIKGAWQTVSHPVQTAKGVGALASGLMSYMPGAMNPSDESWTSRAALRNREIESENRTRERKGQPPLPLTTPEAEKAKWEASPGRQSMVQGRGALNSVVDYYKERYGPGLKYTLARDPVGALADAALLVGGGAGAGAKAAQAANLARTAGALEKVAKVGEFMDPVNLAIKGGSAAAKAGGKGAAFVAGIAPGTGGAAVEEMVKAAARGDKSAVEAMRGATSPQDVVANAEAALDSLRQKRAAEYRSGMIDISNDKTVLNFADVDNAIARIKDIGQYKGVQIDPKANTIWQEIDDVVGNWKGLNPADYHTPEGMDALKKSLGSIRMRTQYGTPERVVADQVYNAVRDVIAKQAPTYAKVMKGYEDATDAISELSNTLTLRPEKGTVDSAYRKLMSTLRGGVDNTRRESLLDILDAETGGTLKPQLAGMTFRDMFNPRREGQVVAGLGAGTAGLVGGIPAAVAAFGAASPRLVGEVANVVGAVGGAPGRTLSLADKYLPDEVGNLARTINDIPLKTNVLSQASEMTQSPEDLRGLLDKYAAPIPVSKARTPEEASELHPALRGVMGEEQPREQPVAQETPASFDAPPDPERLNAPDVIPPATVQFATQLNPDQIAALGIVAEASPNPQEMLAVGHVLVNRLKRPDRYGGSLYEVLLGGEFDAFRNSPEKLMALMDSDRFRQAEQLVQAIKSGEAPDPTNGATHFLAPALMESEGYTTPSWADPEKGVRIGQTVFYPDPDAQSTKPAEQTYKEGGAVRSEPAVAGNIDLHNRPVVKNPDGSISTVRSITVGFDDKTYVLPTVVNGRVVSDQEAIAHFRKTGEHLGAFNSLPEAEAYSQRLHQEQAAEYGKPK